MSEAEKPQEHQEWSGAFHARSREDVAWVMENTDLGSGSKLLDWLEQHPLDFSDDEETPEDFDRWLREFREERPR